MKHCAYCQPTKRAARYEITTRNGNVVLTCAKHCFDALHAIMSNATVRPLAEDGSYKFGQ